MLNKIKNRKQEGFTIIEVLIVLAIAGLIMLIVFFAVPALQRNAQNNEIKNDASRLATGANEFISNSNGKEPTTAAELSQIVSGANMKRLVAADVSLNDTANYATDLGDGKAIIAVPATCSGNTIVAGTVGSREVAVRVGLKGGQDACVQI